MKNIFAKTLLASSLTLFTLSANAANYTYYLSTESGSGSFLEKGSISFVTKTAVTPPTDGSGEVETPVEPETPEYPKEEREFLYSTAISTFNYSGSEYLFNNQELSGTPLSCGDLGISCVVIGHQTGLVSIKYTGYNVNYANGFYHPDEITVKSSYLNTATNCNLSGTSTEPWATQTGGGVHFTMTYNCGSGNLPAPLAPPYTKERNPGTSLGFSIDFFKVIK